MNVRMTTMEEEKDDAKPEENLQELSGKASRHHYWQYCVNCGTLLQSRKCKLFCPKCGFYHSCSEP
jgi:rubrerythrin